VKTGWKKEEVYCGKQWQEQTAENEDNPRQTNREVQGNDRVGIAGAEKMREPKKEKRRGTITGLDDQRSCFG